MRFESREKSLLEKFVHLKRKILQFPIFEAKHINSEAGKPKLRRFKVGRFCDEEMRYLYNFCRLGLENPARYPLPTTNITFIDIQIVGFLA